jgi:hypothetical protein
MKTTTKPSGRVTYTNPNVLKGAPMEGVLDYLPEGPTVFMPDERHHAALVAGSYEPEAGFFLKGATVTPIA